VNFSTVRDMVTNNGARAMRVPDFRLPWRAVVGSVVLDAAIRAKRSPEIPAAMVIIKGRLIAEPDWRLPSLRYSATSPVS